VDWQGYREPLEAICRSTLYEAIRLICVPGHQEEAINYFAGALAIYYDLMGVPQYH
jgi:hypothetical protein